MPETVRMALARCCQRQTNVTVQEKKVSWSLPLDKGHFITGIINIMRYRSTPAWEQERSQGDESTCGFLGQRPEPPEGLRHVAIDI